MKKFSELTKKEIKEICNGCGGKGGWFNPPDFMFTASCNHHDYNYHIGGKEADRLKADKQFLKAMLEDVKRLPWYRRPLATLAAYTYYRAVRTFGKKYFNYW